MRRVIALLVLLISAWTVQSADLIWDATSGDPINDGGGDWLTAGQWNDGTPSATWNNTTPDNAAIGAGGTAGIITLGAVTAGSVTFTNFTGTYTLSGGSLTVNNSLIISPNSASVTITTPVNGSAAITKSAGSGTLMLDATNTLTGDIAINGGTLQVGNNSTASRLSGGTYIGNISIASGAKLLFNNSLSEELSGVISGSGALQKGGGGTLTLSGANTYAGKTTIAAPGAGGPALSVSSFNSVSNDAGLSTVHSASSSLGAPTDVANGTIDLGSGANVRSCTLIYTGPGEITDRVMHLSFNAGSDHSIQADTTGGGLLKFVSAFTVNRSSGDSGSSLTLKGTGDGEIVGGIPNMPGFLAKSGAGAWTISSASTYDGYTTVSAGTLNVNAAGALSSGPVTISGTGILSANATNALGDLAVTVSGGTLVLAGVDCLSDTNSVTINSGKIQLNTGVKEKIGKLFFGAVEQSIGSWGSSTSGAENPNDTYFLGTGKLFVGVPIPSAGTVLILR